MRRAILVAFVLVASSSSSCSFPLRIVLFNNTVSPVTVLVSDEHFRIDPGASAEFRLFTYGGEFTAESAGRHLTYDLDSEPGLNETYNGCTWGPCLRAQLEPDLRLFLVKRSEKFPAAVSADTQPTGFPLTPDA